VGRELQDTRPLSTENVVQLRDRVPVYMPPANDEPIPAYLGLDIGSVSTNVVVIDEFGTVIHDVYLRTAGRPIEAVQQGLAEVERIWGSRLKVCGVGTTGSGRELIAEFVGADVVNDEITAHKTGRSTSAARWAASRWIRSSRSAGRIRSSSRSRTAWWWILR
jgi:activator of 2-hydroxyglutaryl-CoA dehydratase